MRTKLIFIILSLSIFSVPIALADKLILKNGKEVEGKVVEKGEDYLKIDVAGVGVTYYFDQIESLEKVIPAIIVKDEKQKQEMIDKFTQEGGYMLYVVEEAEDPKVEEIDASGEPGKNVAVQFRSLEELAEELNESGEEGPGYYGSEQEEEMEKKYWHDRTPPSKEELEQWGVQ